jgi:hypothetical protein
MYLIKMRDCEINYVRPVCMFAGVHMHYPISVSGFCNLSTLGPHVYVHWVQCVPVDMVPNKYLRLIFQCKFSLMFDCCLPQKDWSTKFTITWMVILGICIWVLIECPVWCRYQQCFHGVDLSSLRQAAMKEYFRQPIVDTFDMRVCMSKSVRHIVDFQEAEESDLHRIGE